MEKLFTKKLLLEIYIPVAIVVGAFVALLTGLSLSVAFGLGILLAVVGRYIYNKPNQSAL